MTMKTLKLFVMIGVLFSCKTNVGESTRPNEHHNDAFQDILSIMKLNGTLHPNNLTGILIRLGINDCTSEENHGRKCVNTESLLDSFNISSNSPLREIDFQKIAPTLIYSLLEENNDATNGNLSDNKYTPISHKIDIYKEFLERYNTSELCEHILDQLLKDVNESMGTQLNKTKCFSSHEILHELNISSDERISGKHLEKISTIIVAELLHQNCIEIENVEPLPCPSFFVDNLFERYAKNGRIHKEKFKELLTNLNIGKQETHGGEDENNVDSDEHEHRRRRHVRKRRFFQPPVNNVDNLIDEKTSRRQRRSAEDHDDDDHHDLNYYKCYSSGDLMKIYAVDSTLGINRETFKLVSSGLLHQVATNICVSESHHVDPEENNELEDQHVWGYGVLAVTIISLCSLLGVLIIPFWKTLFYKKAIIFLISLAVGTLVGDALLHLLPHAIGLHSDDNHNHGDSREADDKSFLWRFLVTTLGIYVFFVFESLTHLFFKRSIGHSHAVEHTRGHSQFATDEHSPGKAEAELRQQNSDQSFVMANMAAVNQQGHSHNADNMNKQSKGDVSEEVEKGISSVAWMIIIGDTIHNVADGIAIGVAFTDSITGGVSTSIAVFCHELPHELGDFAVLLSAGMSVKAALLANFLSSLSCFVGLIFGILIGEIQDANLWIFAITAGFFIYIALTDMLPELMHSSEFGEVSKVTIFIIQNAGMLTGFAIMILLAYYEEHIHI